MAHETSRYAIGELARLTGTTPRTIRYYVAQGLLPAPAGQGPGAHYGQTHLERLQLVKRLQRQHLPLAEIRTRLEGLADGEVAELNREDVAAPPAGSALDYIRSVLGHGVGGHRPPVPAAPVGPAPGSPIQPPARPPGSGALLSRRVEPEVMRSLESRVAEPPLRVETAVAGQAPAPSPVPAGTPSRTPADSNLERSQWERLSLGPNLELHIRRPLSRIEQRRVERLITIARQVLKEETP